ncbi:MAG: multidrug efflux RND transporter permease subunit [Verrucomicrobia bacterium]|nr:multidrug efflux RND transporter permease subunit [Verrucomicrobiota bacterium]
MNISEPFIRRPIATSLLAAGLMLAGLVAYRFLPVAALPQVDFPTINVSVTYPGVDPETAATSLAAPLERRFADIAGVNEITSVSQMNGTRITLQFDLNRDINGAARDVQAAINAASNQLPGDLPSPPTYRKANPNDRPILILALTSDAVPLSQIYNLANELLVPAISQVTGVSEVDVGGGAKTAVRVQVDPAALASMGLSLDNVRAVLQGQNKDEPKGAMDGDRISFTMNANDQLFTANQYKNLIIGEKNGVPIPLSAVGRAIDATEDRLQAGWFNSKRAVVILVRKQADANVIETVDHIKAILPQLQRWLPPAIHLQIQSDRTLTIRASIADVQTCLLISVALVVMVCFVFLRRLSTTFIACITVPLALAGTFAVMYLLKFSLDNISLMALTISVGFVVDDAIVVIENIVRHLEQGLTPLEATLRGARQIGFTVVSISISLVAVFIPLLFMGGIIGRLFHEFSVTLSVAILVSAAVSLTLTPMLCSRLLREERPEQRRGWFYRATEKMFNGMLGIYSRSLRWVLRHSFLMLLVTAVTIGLTIWLYTIVPKGFFPQQDTGLLIGITEAAQDISFDAMVAKQNQVTQIVQHDPAVGSVTSVVGSGGGGSINTGRMFITLKPRKERNVTATQVVARIRGKTARIPGIGVFLQAAQDISIGGRATKGQYIYSLVSPSQEDLNTYVPKLMAALQKNPKLKDLTTDQQQNGLQSNVVVDRVKAAQLGIQPQQIDSALYSAFGQREVSVVYNDRDQFHVVLEASPQYLAEPTALNKIYVAGTTGIQVPLSTIARIETTNTPTAINHQGQFPAVTFSFNLDPGTSLGQATQIIEQAARSVHLPDTIRGSFQGTAQVFQDSLSSQPVLILTAIIAVYIVLGILYESYIHPVTILSTLPSAGLGALLALLLWKVDLSIVSIIGIILLIGIVKKNAIMMVDFAIEAEREQNLSPADAIYQACIVRFRPIMMTTLAAMFGAIPLATGQGDGSEIRQPLGVAIIGGLVVSQLLTLYTTPIIYLYLDRFQQPRHAPAPLPEPQPV